MSRFVDGISFVTEHCCRCGIPFAMTDEFQKRRLKDRETFYCPSGHPQHYSGKSEEEKLRIQLERERQMRIASDARAGKAEVQRDQVAKAHLKMRTRVMNGVCPCCNRTFQNLMQHMKSQHAGEVNLRTIRETYGMTQQAVAEEIGVSAVYVSAFERNAYLPDSSKIQIENWISNQVAQA